MQIRVIPNTLELSIVPDADSPRDASMVNGLTKNVTWVNLNKHMNSIKEQLLAYGTGRLANKEEVTVIMAIIKGINEFQQMPDKIVEAAERYQQLQVEETIENE